MYVCVDTQHILDTYIRNTPLKEERRNGNVWKQTYTPHCLLLINKPVVSQFNSFIDVSSLEYKPTMTATTIENNSKTNNNKNSTNNKVHVKLSKWWNQSTNQIDDSIDLRICIHAHIDKKKKGINDRKRNYSSYTGKKHWKLVTRMDYWWKHAQWLITLLILNPFLQGIEVRRRRKKREEERVCDEGSRREMRI